jgi:predicted transcriptional regulator
MADLVVTAASVLPGTAPTFNGIAGEAITAGQAVYKKAADGKLWKAQCDGNAEEATPVGIALNGAAVGQPVTYAGTGGTINIGATTAKTTTYMLSAAAGGICPQADLVSTNKVVELGYASDTAGTFIVHIVPTGVVV